MYLADYWQRILLATVASREILVLILLKVMAPLRPSSSASSRSWRCRDQFIIIIIIITSIFIIIIFITTITLIILIIILIIITRSSSFGG